MQAEGVGHPVIQPVALGHVGELPRLDIGGKLRECLDAHAEQICIPPNELRQHPMLEPQDVMEDQHLAVAMNAYWR